MNREPTQEEKEAKFKELFERARRGVLAYLDDKGGKLNMGELHDYSMNTYFIQHQRFSQMMETFVGEELLDYDAATQDCTLTEKGKSFIAK